MLGEEFYRSHLLSTPWTLLTHTKNKLLLCKATEVWGLFVIALGSLPYLIQTNKDKLIKISSHWPINSRL